MLAGSGMQNDLRSMPIEDFVEQRGIAYIAHDLLMSNSAVSLKLQ